MTTALAIPPTPQLREALEHLPKIDGNPEAQVTVHVSSVDANAAPQSGRSARDATAVDVEFRRGVLTTETGLNLPVWVYEGELALDPAVASPMARRPEGLGGWLRSQLGPRCLAVTVRELRGRVATVSVAAAISEGGARA